MDTSMNGKFVKTIVVEGAEPGIITAGGNKSLELNATHHGDHDEFWIAEYEGGNEIARHNVKYISSIVWK